MDNGEGINGSTDFLDVYPAGSVVGSDCNAILPTNLTPVLKGNVQVNDVPDRSTKGRLMPRRPQRRRGIFSGYF